MEPRSRSLDEIERTLHSRAAEIYDDQESDKEEDHVEEQGGSDSEEDVGDSDFTVQEAEQSDMDVDDADIQKAGPSSKKTKRVGRPSTSLRAAGIKWCKIPPESRGRHFSEQNRLTLYLPRSRGAAKDVPSMIEAWSLLFTDDMLASIVLHTNESIAHCIEKMANESRQEDKEFTKQTYHNDTNFVEIKALIGVLYYAGIFKVSMIAVHSLWEPESISLFRAVMSRHRFVFLLRNLRFDDKSTRAQRKENDNLAPIRELWDEFIVNCRRYYTPYEYVTIDEQLLSFRGRCPFRIYMKNKPAKYGIKIVMINDSKTYYMFNAIPYVRKVNTEGLESVPSYYVRVLTEPIHGTKRNVTCDNWFTSVPLAEKMMNEPFNLTMVGPIRKNKREIPISFKSAEKVGNIKFAYHGGKTLVSYTPKKNKIVLLLSSFHKTGKIDPNSGKPEIILFYNSTKGGTDTFDQLCQEYTTCRMTRRWPVRLFYGMLDQAGINAMVLYTCNPHNTLSNRREYLRQLAIGLTKPQLEQRLTISSLRTPLRLSIEGIVGSPEENSRIVLTSNKLERKKNCSMCPSSISRKTQYQCLKCRKPMCSEHTSKLCYICASSD